MIINEEVGNAPTWAEGADGCHCFGEDQPSGEEPPPPKTAYYNYLLLFVDHMKHSQR